MKQADRVILQKMVGYCDDISDMINQFGNTYDIYISNKAFQYATSMCILQIGELVNRISEETLNENVQIPWRLIRAMRNIYAHSYDKAEPELAWQTIMKDIPVLKSQLLVVLASKGTECGLE